MDSRTHTMTPAQQEVLKHFDKRYRADKFIKQMRRYYMEQIELRVGSGMSKDKKEAMVKSLILSKMLDRVKEEKIGEFSTTQG